MLTLLLYALLAAQPQVAIQGGMQALAAQDDLLKRNRDEAYLISQRIDGALLRNLQVWTSKTQSWDALGSHEEPGTGAKVRVIHLWAYYCEPCQREFIWLRSLAKAAGKYKGRVQYLFVAEDTPSEQMSTYLRQHKDLLPEGRLFHDTQGQLREALRPGLPSGDIKLPTTVLVDDKGVVRQSIVGALMEPSDRRPEFVAAIERLLALP